MIITPIHFVDNIEKVVKRAWSVRLIVALFVVQLAYELVPVFQDAIPRGYYALIMSTLISLTFFARVTKQPGFDG